MFFGGGSKWCHIYTFFTQFAADEKNFVFFGSKWCHIYYIHIFYTARRRRKISGFWGVKMVPYIHIFYTARRRRENLGFFFRSKCYHIHVPILGGFLGENAAIYTHFWNLISPHKTGKKNNRWLCSNSRFKRDRRVTWHTCVRNLKILLFKLFSLLQKIWRAKNGSPNTGREAPPPPKTAHQYFFFFSNF